jgi:hypothetical protein
MSIVLPVSLGEALDKLSILDIKQRRIQDNRRDAVTHEYNLLYKQLEKFIVQYPFHYNLFIKINESIWDDQDILRATKPPLEEYARLCDNILDMNDMRFRVKNKINLLANSDIKEQKGYALKVAAIDLLGKSTVRYLGTIRYYSLVYDKLIIVVDKTNETDLRLLIGEDPNISYTNELVHDIYMIELTDTYSDYFYIPDYPEQQYYLDMIPTKHIIFTDLTNLNIEQLHDDVFYCNPNIALYPKDHMYYNISQKLTNIPHAYYKKIILFSKTDMTLASVYLKHL